MRWQRAGHTFELGNEQLRTAGDTTLPRANPNPNTLAPVSQPSHEPLGFGFGVGLGLGFGLGLGLG